MKRAWKVFCNALSAFFLVILLSAISALASACDDDDNKAMYGPPPADTKGDGTIQDDVAVYYGPQVLDQVDPGTDVIDNDTPAVYYGPQPTDTVDDMAVYYGPPPTDTSQPAYNPYTSTQVTMSTGQPNVNLAVATIVPSLRATNLSTDTDTITVTFNKDIDDSLFSEDNITLTAEPVDGNSSLHPAAGDLSYAYDITDNILTLSIDTDTTPLQNNNRVILSLSDLYATDGYPLAEAYTSYFTTTYDPLYSTATLVRLQVGNYIKDIPDDTVNLSLLYTSMQADAITPEGEIATSAFLNYLAYSKSEYALWTTCLNLMVNRADGIFGKKSKTLGDLEVTWEQNKLVEKLVEDLRQKHSYYAAVLHNLAVNPLKATMAVKGSTDWDQPLVGRDYNYDPFTAPIVNSNVVPSYSRRKTGASQPFSPFSRRWNF